MIYEMKKNLSLEQNVRNVLSEEGLIENATNIFGKKIVATKGDYKSFLSDATNGTTLKVGVYDYDGDGICSCLIVEKRDKKLGFTQIIVNPENLEKALSDDYANLFISELVQEFRDNAGTNHFAVSIIPNRYTDHYGLGMSIMAKINIIVKAFKQTFNSDKIFIETADNGIRSNEAIDYANTLGYRVMVTDHHQQVGELPNAEVIINPHTCEQPNLSTTDICGATVCALIASDVLNVALAKIWEFASVATVTDVMPLVNENLFLVRWFLSRANKGNLSDLQLEGLLNATGANITAITADDIGFGVGPLLNATGRLKTADMALDYFRDYNERSRLEKLSSIFELNEKRKVLSHEFTAKAMNDEFISSNVVVSVVEGCPEGILGIVSAHVTERTHKPSGILAKAKDGTYTGSFRSVEGFNLLENASKVFEAHPEIVVRYGGHAGAMGATLKDLNSVTVFRNEMSKLFNPSENSSEEKSYIKYDDDYTLKDLYEEFAKYQPFGEGRKKPIFVCKKKVFGYQNIKSMHESWSSYFAGKKVACYNFNCVPKTLSDGEEHTFSFSIHKSVKIIKNQLRVSYEPYVEEILD